MNLEYIIRKTHSEYLSTSDLVVYRARLVGLLIS